MTTKSTLFAFFLLFNGQLKAQNCAYEKSMAAQGLVNVQMLDPKILVQLKYSTTDNFMKKDVYGCITKCYLQKVPAQMLAKANNYLQKINPKLRLLVYDGARPLAVQKLLWNALPQYPPKKRKTFVADPTEGSIHNYGSAVDLTLADYKGTALDMGTAYDFFGDLAYPKLESHFLKTGKLNSQQITNRKLLRKVMVQAGFMPIEYEWWHFNALSKRKAKTVYRIIQ